MGAVGREVTKPEGQNQSRSSVLLLVGATMYELRTITITLSTAEGLMAVETAMNPNTGKAGLPLTRR
jgi:hypothetical protein